MDNGSPPSEEKMMYRFYCSIAILLGALLSASAKADRLEPFHGAVFKDPLGHFTVGVPLGAMPCVRTSDELGGRRTLMLFFGDKNPCPEAWDFEPVSSVSTSWQRKLGDYTVIEINATAILRKNYSSADATPEYLAAANCGFGPGRWTNRDVESPFMFGDLPGHVCRGEYWGQAFWWSKFHRPWINAQDADRDSKGNVIPWIEYAVELYGSDKGVRRHYRKLEQVFKSITLIPASPDAARNW